MAGTKVGGAKASITNQLRYGEDFYSKVGGSVAVRVVAPQPETNIPKPRKILTQYRQHDE